ncbi:MAG: Ig domain-containing protein [Acidobacteriota bacterium]
MIFGGNDGTTPLDDTWEYDGIAWSPGAPPPAGMVPRFWPSIAYDAARALSVTFGGKTATGYVNDAWEYDGTAWAPGATAGPALDARESFAMAAFPEAGGLILFGGYDGAESKADTWLYQTIAIDPPVLPRAVIGRPYAITLAATGGSAPRAFALTAGSLPAGLTLSAGGVLSGTPAIASTATFLVRASDGGGNAGSRRYVLEVTPVPDYVTGEGLGPGNENRVAAYDETGAPTPVDFRAYSAGSWGVNVSGGNVDPDAHDEIVTGPGPGATLGPHVRGFRFDGSPISKVTFFAYGTLRYGVNAAAASIDTDPFAEVVTGAGPGPVFGPHVRAFTYDGVAVAPIPGVSFFAYATPRYGVNASGGDIDGDAYAEIVTGAGPSPVFAPQVRTWDYDDDAIAVGASFQAFLPPQFGVNVAAGDFDRDGLAELAATPGPGPALTSQFVGFDVAGATVTAMPGFAVTPFATYYGGRVGSGDVDGNSDVELLTGAGRDPVATSTVLSFAYSGSALVPAGASFTPFPGGYGVNASSAALGY